MSRPRVQSLTFFFFFVSSYTDTYKCLWLPWGFTFVVTYVSKTMKCGHWKTRLWQ